MSSHGVLTALITICSLLSLGPRIGGQPGPRTDLLGDSLPAGAIARLGTARLYLNRLDAMTGKLKGWDKLN